MQASSAPPTPTGLRNAATPLWDIHREQSRLPHCLPSASSEGSVLASNEEPLSRHLRSVDCGRTASPSRLSSSRHSPQLLLGHSPIASRDGNAGKPQSLQSNLHSAANVLRRSAPAPVLPTLGSSEYTCGARHAGWLWKRFGQGHRSEWRRLWCYIADDRFYYSNPEAGPDMLGYSNTGSAARADTTLSSTAALAAGRICYIALDRIPVRPLPHRQHPRGPTERSHPDVGVTLVDER